MQLQIHLPEHVPLHGIGRDAFEAKPRDALHDQSNGHRVRQSADPFDARRVFNRSVLRPLRRTGDGHAFDQCFAPDACELDDMSGALRRIVLSAVGARPGLDLVEPGLARDAGGKEGDATNGLPPVAPPDAARHPERALRVGPGFAGVPGAAADGRATWWIAQPASVPRAGTVAFTSPAPGLRELAGSVPAARRPYRIPLQVGPQATAWETH